MGQKINPIALRLGGRINWWSLNPNNRAKNSNLHESIFINYLVSGVFKSFNIFVSELVIKKETISSDHPSSIQGSSESLSQGNSGVFLPCRQGGAKRIIDINLASPHKTGGYNRVISNEYLLWNYRRKDFIEINKIIKNEAVTGNPINREGDSNWSPQGATHAQGACTKTNNKNIIKISGLIYLGSSPKSFSPAKRGEAEGRMINRKARPASEHGAPLSSRRDETLQTGPIKQDNNIFNKLVRAIKNKSGKNQSRRTKLLLEEINKLIIKLLKIVLLGGNYKSQTDIILDFEQIRSPLSNSNILSNWIELSLLENSRIMNDRKIFKWLFSDSLGKPRESRFIRGKQGHSTVRGK